MPRVALTDRFVAGAKSIDGPQTDYFDAKCPGLALRVSSTGHKSWTLHFTAPGGKRSRATLGTYPVFNLAEARSRALEARAQLQDGNDPRGAGTANMTVAQVAERYLVDPEKAQRRSMREITRRFRRDILPVIGHIRLADLTKRDVRNVTDAIMQRGAMGQAWNTFKDCRGLLNWAVANDFMQHNPIDGVKAPGGFEAGERTLSDEEIHKVWHALPAALSLPFQRVLKLCLITGQRVGECAGMMRGELDLVRRIWTLPGARTKNGHQHSVPLSELAVSIIRGALRDTAVEAVFIGETGKPLQGQRVSKAIQRIPCSRFGTAEHWSPHDLRRTCLDNMARLGVQPHVIAYVANHRSISKSGVTFAHYVQHSYEAEKRAALELWADRLQALIDGRGAEIIPIGVRA